MNASSDVCHFSFGVPCAYVFPRICSARVHWRSNMYKRLDHIYIYGISEVCGVLTDLDVLAPMWNNGHVGMHSYRSPPYM